MSVADWSFLTNHARLLCIAHDPGVGRRDIAVRTGVTEHTAYGIVTDLTEAGYVVKHKDGRRGCVPGPTSPARSFSLVSPATATRWARTQNQPMTRTFSPAASLNGRCPDAVSSGKPEEQQHTDDERDGCTDK